MWRFNCTECEHTGFNFHSKKIKKKQRMKIKQKMSIQIATCGNKTRMVTKREGNKIQIAKLNC
jgi:hypothetical protein